MNPPKMAAALKDLPPATADLTSGSQVLIIVICSVCRAAATYDNFVEDLKEAEEMRQCRYGVFDADYKLKDGQSRQKLVFFLWSVVQHSPL